MQQSKAQLQFGDLRQYQLAVLVLLSLVGLWMSPPVYNGSPDSGFYLGGAVNLIEEGRYWYSGKPILQYFPGFSALLTLPISIFGTDFQILHLFSAGFAISTLWLSRFYFTTESNGVVGLLVPILIACTGIYLEQVVYILSDGPFLAFSLALLIAWRMYEDKEDRRLLLVCAVLAAFLPFIRFQGLFALVAFWAALTAHLVIKRDFTMGAVARFAAICLVTALPLVLWGYRNYILYSPDNFNMFNSFFFGQAGLPHHADPGMYKVDWIDENWKYGVYNFMYLVRDFGSTTLGAGFMRLVRLDVFVVLCLALIGMGGIRWFHGATWLERIYVLVFLAFIAQKSLTASNFFTIPRYLFPMLPFLLLAAGFGISAIFDTLKRFIPPALPRVLAGVVATLVAANGISLSTNRLQPSTFDYYRGTYEVLMQMREYAQAHIPQGAHIATPEWGVVPFLLQREFHLALADPSRIKTLQVLVENKLEYLVILDGLGRNSRPAQDMVDELPQVFSTELSAKPNGHGRSGYIYRVDLTEASRVLNERLGTNDTTRTSSAATSS